MRETYQNCFIKCSILDLNVEANFKICLCGETATGAPASAVLAETYLQHMEHKYIHS
jgi:hypothetical protein